MEALGRHILLEYYGCAHDAVDNHESLEEILVGAARAMGATVVSVHFHKFNPHGVSGVVVISESHLTVHTWPEYGYAAIDVFTCGDVINPWKAHTYMKERLKPTKDSVMEVRRGCFDVPEGTLPSYYAIHADDQK